MWSTFSLPLLLGQFWDRMVVSVIVPSMGQVALFAIAQSAARGEGCRIHRLLLCRGVRLPPNECPGFDTKQSDGEVPVMLELWGMRSTPSLPLLPGPL